MSRNRDEEAKNSAILVEEFLAKGGKITLLPFGKRTDAADIKMTWDKGKAKKAKPSK
jgi:hypothetical protein